MSEGSSLYSESWYRVRHQHIRLRPTVQVRKQAFRGNIWYVVEDPFNNRFFRFRPEAYTFIARLTEHKTVEEVWQQCLDEDPENAPGQPEVIRMLAQLYQASLLQSDLSPDAARLFERHRRQKQRELKAKLLSILFIRIPLFDPNRLLDRLMPLVNPLISKVGLAIWLVVVVLGIKTVLGNGQALMDQSEGILAPGRLALLYLCFIVVKILHEAGHGFLTKKFGGEVHTAGIMLMVFNPIPYIDATAAWAFRERWKRVLVGTGGVGVEVFLASIAAFVWAATEDGLYNAIAYNVMFVASVSTLLLNINPLMRFDGYYILSDLTDTPNLNQRSNRQFLSFFERHLLGNRDAEGPAESRNEAFWLSVFAVAGWGYRLFIFTVILWFVADQFFGLGFIAAIVGIVTFIIVPIVRLILFLIYEPRIEEVRGRAQAVSAVIALALVLFLTLIPLPDAFRARGVVQASPYRQVFAESPGYIGPSILPSMQWVDVGDTLFSGSNREAEIEFQSALAEQDQVEALLLLSVNDPKIRKPALQRAQAVTEKIERLALRRQQLDYHAPISGLWVAPRLEEQQGTFARRGTPIGVIVNPDRFSFLAVVEQRHARHLFDDTVRDASLRIPGQAHRKIPLQNLQFIPAEQNRLPHASLGWAGGGPFEVSREDSSGLQTVEPFFLVRADISPSTTESLTLNHNLQGHMRFKLPPSPLYFQTYRWIRQLLQERFEL